MCLGMALWLETCLKTVAASRTRMTLCLSSGWVGVKNPCMSGGWDWLPAIVPHYLRMKRCRRMILWLVRSVSSTVLVDLSTFRKMWKLLSRTTSLYNTPYKKIPVFMYQEILSPWPLYYHDRLFYHRSLWNRFIPIEFIKVTFGNVAENFTLNSRNNKLGKFEIGFQTFLVPDFSLWISDALYFNKYDD